MFLYFVTVYLWITVIHGQGTKADSRCYLEGGGSTENFLVSENLKVGSIIGTLGINGNTDKDFGNISLSLRERNSAISIEPESKEITLVKELDKEGVSGPSAVYVDVICRRRHSNDPSFVIPVNIRVTDVNDNAPVWIGAPYTLMLNEVTLPGTRILQGVEAVDADQTGSFSTVEYYVLPGKYSDYVSFVSPLEGTMVLKKPLDYETIKNFTVQLRAQDQGKPPKYTDTLLNILVSDADDQNPIFLKDSYQSKIENDNAHELKIFPEPIRAVDQDEGIQSQLVYSIVPSPESQHFEINSQTGSIKLKNLPLAADHLRTITLVIKATQIDNMDRYALTTLTISRNLDTTQLGQLPVSLRFLQNIFYSKVKEDSAIGTYILTLTTNYPEKNLQYNILNKNESVFFTVNKLGEIILKKSLDFENKIMHKFPVMVTYNGMNSTAEIIIDVLDVNDWEPRFRQNDYQFVIPKKNNRSESLPLGILEVADGDRNDNVTISIRGINSNLFYVDTFGMLWFKSPILADHANLTRINLIAIASDTGNPSRSSSVPVTIIMEDSTLSYHDVQWTTNILGIFGIVSGIFIIIIIVMLTHIYKRKKRLLRNRIHSQVQNKSKVSNQLKLVKLNAMPNQRKCFDRHKCKVCSGVNVRSPSIDNNQRNTTNCLDDGECKFLNTALNCEMQTVQNHSYAEVIKNAKFRSSGSRENDNNERRQDDADNDEDISNMEKDSISSYTVSTKEKWPDENSKGVEIYARNDFNWNNQRLSGLQDGKAKIMESNEDISSNENQLTVYF